MCPCAASETGERNVMLWLSSWGDARKELPGIREDWAAMLDRLFLGWTRGLTPVLG